MRYTDFEEYPGEASTWLDGHFMGISSQDWSGDTRNGFPTARGQCWMNIPMTHPQAVPLANASGIYRSTLADALLRRQRKVPRVGSKDGDQQLQNATKVVWRYSGTDRNCRELVRTELVFVMGPRLCNFAYEWGNEHPIQLPTMLMSKPGTKLKWSIALSGSATHGLFDNFSVEQSSVLTQTPTGWLAQEYFWSELITNPSEKPEIYWCRQ